MARRRHRIVKALLLLVIVVVTATGGYVGYVAIRAAQPVILPAPTGTYPVGRTIVEWIDHGRVDPLAPQAGTPRELSVWLWYPALPESGRQPAPYAPGLWADLHVGGFAETGFDHVADHAFADVPVATGRFPVVVLEPGLGFAAPQYTTVAENLASHGYMVVGVTPTYSANLTVLNGHTVPTTDAGNPPAFNTADLHAGQAQAAGDRLIDVWAADGRFAASQVDADSRFTEHLDATRTVYLGHSFGGAAALEACHADQHCVGAADLDGTQYGSVVHSGLAKPMLIMASDHSCVTGSCDPTSPDDRSSLNTARTVLAASTGPIWCYQLNGAAHFNFSDYGAYYLAAPLRSQLALGGIDGATALTVVDAYLTAFVDHVALGRPETLLDQRPSPYHEVEVQRAG